MQIKLNKQLIFSQTNFITNLNIYNFFHSTVKSIIKHLNPKLKRELILAEQNLCECTGTSLVCILRNQKQTKINKIWSLIK